MGDFLFSVFTNFILNRLEETYNGFRLKIKLCFLRFRLKKDLSSLVDRYKDTAYYNSFDKFLSEGHYAENIVGNCFYREETIKSSLTKYIEMIVQDFIQQNREYAIYKNDLTTLLEETLRIAFEKINDYTNDETARMVIVCLSEEIRANTENLIERIGKNKEDIVELLGNKIDKMHDEILVKSEEAWENRINNVNIKEYKLSLSDLFLDKKKYISRELSDRNGMQKSCVDVLLQQKKVLLLGDPGCGKTYEALNVLKEVCVSPKFASYIPVYLRLVEYGIGYNSIIQAVQLKLKPFIGELEDVNVIELIKKQRIVLILDGVDEIIHPERKIKFKSDVNEIMRYMDEYCLITSRVNQYHNDVDNIMQYRIEGLSKREILQVLHENKIYRKLPDEYYDLFKTPLFLDIGIKVISEKGEFSHNKSALFTSYIYQICYGREKEKGTLSRDTSFYEMLSLIGKLAFEFFDSAYISFEQFGKFFSKNKSEYSEITICDVFRIDIFKIDGGVWFLHKQFKEYFASYYLLNTYCIEKHIEFYKELMLKEDWQDVLVFVSGLIENIEQQNLFFDMLLGNNLKTYIESVRLKNDLSESLDLLDEQAYTKYYLETLYKSYVGLIKCYFKNIDYLFEPMIGTHSPQDSEVCIVGGLFDKKKKLIYWFDRSKEKNDKIKIVEEENISLERKRMEERAMRECRTIILHSINLERARYSGDSARVIAINLVRDHLLKIIKNKKLQENNYILCERLYSAIHSVSSLKGKSIPELVAWSNQYILDIKKQLGNIEFVRIEYNRINVVWLNYVAKSLMHAGVSFENYLLPGPDQKFKKGMRRWDLYSDKQKINRIQTFFYWKEVSYLEMIDSNFPKMMKYFRLAQDVPFKYKLRIALNREIDGVLWQPAIEYYHLSVQSPSDIVPEIELMKEVNGADYEEIMSEIQQSYSRNDRKPKYVAYSTVSFDCILNGRSWNDDLPLADSVYDQFKNDVEELFG